MANYISQVTLPSGTSYDVRELFPHVGNCTDAAATAAKTVTIGNFKLYTGAWVVVKFSNTNSAAVASLTLNVDGTGAKPIKYRNANLGSAGSLIANRYTYFIYDGTNYQIVGDFDTNSDTYNRTRTDARIYAGTVGVFNYSLCAVDNNQRIQSFTTTAGTGTSKAFNTSAHFLCPPVIFYHHKDATVANGSAVENGTLYEQYPSTDIRYSCNKTSSAGFTAYKPLYIECDINDDGTWSITSNGLTQTFISGKYYIFLGSMYNTSIYQLALTANHSMMYYDGTNLKIVEFTAAEKTKLTGIATGATKVESSSTNGKIKINGTDTTVYTHPTYTSKTSGLYKITVDSTGHVSGTESVSPGDIPALNYVPNTQAGMNAAINLLSTGSSTPTDADYYISQYVGGGTSTTSYHRRPMSALWSYVKGKADSVYSPIGHTHPLSIAADSGTNQLTLSASTKYKLTAGGSSFIFTTSPNTTYSAGTGLSLSGTTFNHSNSVTAVTSNAFKKIAYDANGHITGSENVAKSDITALGIPGQDTKYGLSGAYGSNSNTWVTTLTAGGSGTTSTVPTASTSVYGITKLYNGVDSTSTGLAATANAVKTAYDKGNHSHPYLPLSGGTLTGTVTFGSSSSPISVGMDIYTKNTSSYVNAIKWSYGDTWGTYGASIGYHNQYSTSDPGTNGSITILPYQTTSKPWEGQVGLYLKKDHGYIDGNEIVVHKDVTASTLDGSSGTFAFSGSGDPWPGYDWVGLQIGDDVDKFQITASGGNLLIRQNDNGGATSTGWTTWKTLSDTTHTHSEYVPFSGGTMNNNVSLSFPKADADGRYTSINTNGIDCHGTPSLGWAMGLRYYIGDTSQNMDFGGYGSGGEFKYLYIGTWDAPIVKITSDKVSEFSGNVVLHSASGNSPSLTFQHGTTIDSLLDWRMMAVGNDLKLYSSTSGSTESWSNILTLGGIGVQINKKIGGLWVTDYKNTSYPMIRDNGENLWIGTMSTSSYHHNGGTYISTGWDHSESLPTAASQTLYGNETIKISVPRYSTNASGTGSWNGANYNAIHDGPQLTTTRYLVNSSTAIPPIHRAMFPNIRSNKLSFVPASNVVVEYSTDNGSTWVNMSTTVSGTNNAISDAMKAQLTTGRWDCNIPVGPNNTSVARTTSMQTRITLTLTDRDCMIDQIYMQLNPGYHSFHYTVQYATTTSPSDSDWVDWKDDFAVATWIYEDTVNGTPIRIGNTAKKLRFIFKQTYVNASYNKNLSTIKDIAAYGGQGSWTSPNEMFRYDHMYSWDYNKNVDFPADVSGNSLTAPTVNISSGASYKASINASGLTQNRTITIGDVSGNVGIVKVLHDNSSYAAGQSVSITTSETFKYFIVTIKPNNTFGEKTEIIRITNDTTVSTKYISFTGDIGPAPSQPTITLGGYITHQYNTTNKTYTIGAGHAANYILCNNNITSVSADSITLAITKIVGLA